MNLPCVEVTPHDNPAHNGEALNRQSANFSDVVGDDFIVGLFATAGNAVGSPLLGNEYDPVTTEPKGEASVAVTAQRYVGAMANLEPVQYAGSWLGNIHFPSYISGYFDGEAAFQRQSHLETSSRSAGKFDQAYLSAKTPTERRSSSRSTTTSVVEQFDRIRATQR